MQQRKTLLLARLGLFTTLTVVMQLAGLPQPVTGPLVNAMLFLTAQLLRPRDAAILGVITPVTALVRGQLPPALAAMLPVIAAGNIAMVYVFAAAASRKSAPSRVFGLRWTAAVSAASAVKFALLYAGVSLLLPKLLAVSVPAPLIALMSLPQLLTALAGGLISGAAMVLLQRKQEIS
ncbi:ECF transporter S component [bacterium]|nr:ECF transporter S component [bacterium]